MDVKELRLVHSDFYSPAQVAAVLHWDPQYIRVMGRDNPGGLPCPVLTHKRRVQIPAGGFWAWWDAMANTQKEGDET